jgi:hypothetical protein
MNTEKELKALITKYRICWSVFPEKALVDETLRQTGFRLELYGTHPPDVVHADPGCAHCHEVWTALKTVADSITPPKDRDSEYDVETFDDSIHYSRLRRNRPDVELHIEIIHKSGFGPVNECENRCLKEMTAKLQQLGATEDYWKEAV